MRAHLYKAITDINGDIQINTVVRMLQPDTDPSSSSVFITDPVFVAKTGTDEKGSTFTATEGVIDVWMDIPQYVMLGLAPPDKLEYFIDNVAVIAPSGSVELDVDGVPYVTI